MSESDSTLYQLIQRKAPEYVDLLRAPDEAKFDEAFEALLERTVMQLETNKDNFESLGETGLSGALAMGLNMPGLSVTQETHSNGHVDLTIVADHCAPARKKLGEAKIYDGPAYHIAGLNQLLGRYTTGREGRGLLIVYFRKADIAGLTRKLREFMDQELPCEQRGPCANHRLKWSFVSKHHHVCGDDLEVGHVFCNLFVS